jgi:hypothetical protein
MSKAKVRDNVERKRIWIRVLPDTHKALLHLAIDLDEGVERLAGELLAEAIERARADVVSGKRKPKPR